MHLGEQQADTEVETHKQREVNHMKKIYVRAAALVASLAGLLLAGGAGFQIR